MNLQSVGYVAGPVFFIGYEVFRRLQPNAIVGETDAGKDPDNSEPNNCKSLDANPSWAATVSIENYLLAAHVAEPETCHVKSGDWLHLCHRYKFGELFAY